MAGMFGEETPEEAKGRIKERKQQAQAIWEQGAAALVPESWQESLREIQANPQAYSKGAAFSQGLGLLGGQISEGLQEAGIFGAQDPEKVRAQAMAALAAAKTPGAVGPEGVDPNALAFAGGDVSQQMGQQMGGLLGMGMQIPTLPKGASLAPIREARGQLPQPQEIAGVATEAIGTMQKATQKRVEAEQAESTAIQKRVQSQAGVYATGLEAVRQARATEQKKVDAARAGVDKSMADYKTALNDWKSMEVDPQQRYKSLGSKIMSAIAMGLGAFAEGMGGGPNIAMKIIQSEIERNVEAQRINIEKAGQQAKVAESEVGMARQLMQDAESQRLAAVNAQWDTVKEMITLEAWKSKAPESKAAAAKNIATIEQTQAKNETDIRTREMTTRLSAGQAQVAAATGQVGAAQRNVQLRQAGLAREAQLKTAASKQLAQASVPPTLELANPNYKPPEWQTKSAVKISQSHGNVMTHIDRAIAWRIKHGTEDLPGDAMADANIYTERLLKAILKHDDAGANVSELERKMTGIRDHIGDYGYVLREMKTLKNLLADSTTAVMAPTGYVLSAQRTKGRGKKVSK